MLLARLLSQYGVFPNPLLKSLKYSFFVVVFFPISNPALKSLRYSFFVVAFLPTPNPALKSLSY